MKKERLIWVAICSALVLAGLILLIDDIGRHAELSRIKSVGGELGQWDFYARQAMDHMRAISYVHADPDNPEPALPEDGPQRLLTLTERVGKYLDKCVVANAMLKVEMSGEDSHGEPPHYYDKPKSSGH